MKSEKTAARCVKQSAWQNYAKLKILLVGFALSKLTILWSNRFFCPSHVACFALDLQGLDLEKGRLQGTLPILSLETSLQISSFAMSTSSWRRTLRCTCRLRRNSSKWPNAVAVNFTLSNPTGARRRMLKELGNPINVKGVVLQMTFNSSLCWRLYYTLAHSRDPVDLQ